MIVRVNCYATFDYDLEETKAFGIRTPEECVEDAYELLRDLTPSDFVVEIVED